MIIASAPGRAGILGNPTDGYGGAVIACSVPVRAYAAIELDAVELKVVNRHETKVFAARRDFEPQGDRFDIFRSVIRFLGLYDLRAEVHLRTDIPEQAGLAGSTALLSAILAGLTRVTGQSFTPYYFAEMNRIIELEYMRIQCGYNDAYMTTFGGLNYMDFRGKAYYRPLDREDYATIEPLSRYVTDLPFIVAHTGQKHHSGMFHRPLRERWMDGEKAVVEGYREIARLALRGKRLLLDRDWHGFGRLMNENYQIQESLSPSGPVNARMVEAALASGALGAKLAGAGGGGTIIALALNPDRTMSALREAGAWELFRLSPQESGVVVDEAPREIALAQLYGELGLDEVNVGQRNNARKATGTED